MKGRIFGSLFALPFFAFGAWMLWLVSSSIYDAIDMRDWVPTKARLITAGYKTHSGDDSNTYEAYARYTYSFNGQTLTGERVAIASGSDNIGRYQQRLGSRLSSALARGEAITVFVNAANPSEAIIDRSLRWELIAFKSLFVVLFGGGALFVLIRIWRAPAEKDASLPEYQQSPWLLNDRWQTENIRSDSKNAMWGAWLFAVVWNLISAPLPFLIYEEVLEKQNYIALVGLLFPLVGIGLAVWAIRRTREWRRFGATPVALDPFPGSIGGHVGGTIDTNLPYDTSHRFMLTLTSVHSYESGSGDSRSQREKALWQDELVAHAESAPSGTRLTFRFDVPEGLRESDAEQFGDSYKLWRLNLRAELADADLDRDFNIPVYETATDSRHIDHRQASSARIGQNAIHDETVRELVRVRQDGIGKQLVYPMGRNFWSNVAGFIIGATFAAIGWYLIVEEGARIFGAVFGGVGALVALTAGYMMFKSLEITQQGDTIRSTRRWLGIPLRTREIRRSDFSRFEKDSSMQTQTGGKHVMYYKVRAVDRHTNELLVGEGFRGESGADAAIRFLSRELGLKQDERSMRRSREDFDSELVNEF